MLMVVLTAVAILGADKLHHEAKRQERHQERQAKRNAWTAELDQAIDQFKKVAN